MTQKTIRLTMAQALVRYLINQFIDDDGVEKPLFPGIFAIFGHGNVTCLGEALEPYRDRLPVWRGQNEQSMAMAAIAYAKEHRRRQIMIALSSIGPGSSNMMTAAAAAYSNRLPVLLLSGDVFATRRPDPVLQQTENFQDATATVSDGFKPFTRYWDRITYPSQIISSLPHAISTMLDPATAGPAFIGLCQDVQEMAYDYPEAFFAKKIHHIDRPRADKKSIEQAVETLKKAERPLVIAGGGVRYSKAEQDLQSFAEKYNLPVVETIAGKGTLIHGHQNLMGMIGVSGSDAGNMMAANADCIIAIGTRLQDYITGSWTCFPRDAKFVSINTTRFDSVKHQAQGVVGDAKEALADISEKLGSWKADKDWLKRGQDATRKWYEKVEQFQKPDNGEILTYAQVVGAVNAQSDEFDTVVSSAGGIVGELLKGWHVKGRYGFDSEMGSSTMGYEIGAGWGTAMARNKGEVYVMLGDGSYLMANSDIYSSVLTGHKIIVIVCDNEGFAVIRRLQVGKGNVPYNNMIAESKVKQPFGVDFAAHAAAMGAATRRVDSYSELEDALDWARKQDKSCLIHVPVAADKWTPGDSFWDVGVPEISHRKEVCDARAEQVDGRKMQREGV